ncbi:hypothetical protein [Pseudomonas sp. MWU12-2323]|uniref:hypothetical protein n=1 Tax=Pseudomonas sp. MWU12-2323 TaxID=2651296 RepID=UPI00128AED85|nr:hypothetical protein [Pseudomonas sp. MWU12-2323]MPQ69281.1 hypothetical protein [Pseudomonas sp. MWU12-2323]
MRTAKLAPGGWVQFMRSLARDAGLKVVIGHNVSAATDAKTLWLPALPAELTPDDLVVFKGDSFHEVGHIRRSDIKFFQAFSKKFGSFAGFLLNALDDVYMEGREAAWKAMAARFLRDSTMVLINRGRFRDGSAGLGEAVACYSLAYLTAKRWPTVGIATVRIEGNLRKHLAQHADRVIPALRDLLDAEFPKVGSTEDGGTLALKIIQLLKSLAEQEQSQSSPSNESGEDQDDAESSDDAEPSQSDDPSNSEPDSNERSEGEGGGDEPESDPQGDGTGESGTDDSESDPKGEGKGEGASDDSKPESKDDCMGEGDAGQSESTPEGEGKGGGNGEAGDAGSESDSNDGSGDTSGKQGEQDCNGEGQNGSGAQGSEGKSLQQMVDEMLNEELGNQEVFDKRSAIEELAESIAKGEIEAYKGQPLIDGLVFDFSPGAGQATGFVDGMPVVEGDREMANVIADVTGRKANAMGNKLRALLSNCEETEEYSARTGRLCEKNLYRVAISDSRIFAKAEERVEETAAVSITADLSGSTGMVNEGTTVAEQIRIALTLIENVLHEIGTPREILGFAPESGEMNCMVKTFGDNHRVALDRIAGMHRLVGGDCTPIGAAVLQAGTRLLGHEAQRKLLLVITDGLPDNAKQASEMTDAVLRTGVEVIYLVIGSPSACKWLEDAKIKFAHANNAEGLIPALVSKVAEFLS